jgi:hypothetical protein
MKKKIKGLNILYLILIIVIVAAIAYRHISSVTVRDYLVRAILIMVAIFWILCCWGFTRLRK